MILHLPAFGLIFFKTIRKEFGTKFSLLCSNTVIFSSLWKRAHKRHSSLSVRCVTVESPSQSTGCYLYSQIYILILFVYGWMSLTEYTVCTVYVCLWRFNGSVGFPGAGMISNPESPGIGARKESQAIWRTGFFLATEPSLLLHYASGHIDANMNGRLIFNIFFMLFLFRAL